jgi:hypothetical protein
VDLLSQANLVIDGAPNSAGFSSYSVAPAGDVNGDGIPDVIIGAGEANVGNQGSGAAYVVFGQPRVTHVDLTQLGPYGFRIDGAPPVLPLHSHDDPSTDLAGYRVAGIGDVNGDGLADVAVAAPFASNNRRPFSGSVYVIFGKRDGGTVNLAALGSHGYRIDGPAGGAVGFALAAAGDVNGDGRPDLVLGSEAARFGQPQQAYVVFGKSDTSNIDLTQLGEHGFVIRGGQPVQSAGLGVAGVGDVNGDGLADVAIGAPLEGVDQSKQTSAGAVYVVYGQRGSAPVDLGQLAGHGYRISGPSGGQIGFSLAGAGDFNGDGHPDLLIGAPGDAAAFNHQTGTAYVVFGQTAKPTIDLNQPGNDGVTIRGAQPGDGLGRSVAGIGDIRGDGHSAVLLGAPTASVRCRVDAGAAYVVYGQSAGTIDLANLGSGGYRIDGANTLDNLGAALATVPGAFGHQPGLLLAAPHDQLGSAPVAFGFPPWSTYMVPALAAPPLGAPPVDNQCVTLTVTGHPAQDLRRRKRLTASLFLRDVSPPIGHSDRVLFANVSLSRASPSSRHPQPLLASTTITNPHAGTTAVTLKLSARGRRQLRRHHPRELFLSATETPNGANECCSQDLTTTTTIRLR